MISFTKWACQQIKENKTVKEGDWEKYRNKKASKSRIKEASKNK